MFEPIIVANCHCHMVLNIAIPGEISTKTVKYDTGMTLHKNIKLKI